MKTKIINILIGIWILILLGLGFFAIRTTIMGQVVLSEEKTFTDIIDETFTENITYIFELNQTYNIKAVRLSGSVIGNGTVRIYLERNNERYLVYDSYEDYSGMLDLTGKVIEDVNISENKTIEEINQTINNSEEINATEPINESSQEINKTITIDLKYKSGTQWDINDDGSETTEGVIDFTVEDTGFNWDVDEEKLCTKWSIYSVDNDETNIVCYGSQNCCNFIGIQSSLDSWKDALNIYYQRYGSTLYNKVKVQVVYYNETESLPEIYYSEENELNALFTAKYYFNEKCVESCTLNFNASFFNLIVELDNAVLKIDNITYTAIENEEVDNQPPQLVQDIASVTIERNSFATINLAEHFTDPNEDLLQYNYYPTENVSVIIKNGIATLRPDANFTGIRYMYFVANDSKAVAVSNVFNISVFGETKNRQPVLLSRIPDIKVSVNKEYVINLNDYFADPDLDSLNFDYYRADNLSIIIENNVATIIPEVNFVGILYTYFTASDSVSSVSSNVFAINVTQSYYTIGEKYVPVSDLYYENNCYGELCPVDKYVINPDLFCTLVNQYIYDRDFEAEMTFNISDLDANFNSASVCAYEDTSFHTLPVTNYIEAINDSIPSAAPNLTKINYSWPSGYFAEEKKWQCIEITDIVKETLGEGKQFIYLRWWGQDMNSTKEPFACFLGINSSLQDCGNNPSNATDCRPYLNIT